MTLSMLLLLLLVQSLFNADLFFHTQIKASGHTGTFDSFVAFIRDVLLDQVAAH